MQEKYVYEFDGEDLALRLAGNQGLGVVVTPIVATTTKTSVVFVKF